MTPMRSETWALDPSITYLDHGAFGACPRAVLDAQTALRNELEAHPAQFFMKRLEPLLDDARAALSSLLGAEPRDLVFVSNATAAVNAVLRSVDLRPGDEVLVTNHGYGGVRKALMYAVERAGATMVVADVPFPIASTETVVEAVVARASDRTRLAIIDHVTSPTALVFPIEQIVGALRARGVETLVDGAHAPGMIPVDLDRLGAAYYAGTCHKWLCAPKGSGFLWIRTDCQEAIHPTSISHGFKSFRDDRPRLHLEFDWPGTVDPTPWLCIPRALETLGTMHPDGIAGHMARNRALVLQARDLVQAALGTSPPAPDEMVGAMVSLPIREAQDDEYGDDFATDPLHRRLLAEHRIDAQVICWPEWPRRVLRLSAQAYNARDDFERLATALRELGMNAGA